MTVENDVSVEVESGREAADVESAASVETSLVKEPPPASPGRSWRCVVVFAVLPGIIVLLAAAAGVASYRAHRSAASEAARTQSVQTAIDSTVALLSYQPDTAEKSLDEASNRLTGTFRESYMSLIHDVVIPGAKQKNVSTVVTVPGAASVSASPTHAVVLVFVNQSVIVGSDAPTVTVSCVRVGLDKIGDRWLVAQFDPI